MLFLDGSCEMGFVEGWKELKRKDSSFGDPRVDSVLGRETGNVREGGVDRSGRRRPERRETFADLLIDARHDFAHFKPWYLPTRWRRLEVEAGHFPRELHEAFVSFFSVWFHRQREP